MVKDHQRVHPKFKLNGAYFKELAFNFKNKNSLIKNKSLASFLSDWLNDNDQIKLKTSGTTGDPKEIKVDKKAMILSAQSTGRYFNIIAGDNALLCLPIDFIAGKMMIVRAIVLGIDLHIINPSSYPINKLSQNFDLVAMTPFQLEKTINYIHKIKCLLIGGSPISENLIEKIVNKTTGVFETYGMTETVSHIAVKNLSAGGKSFESIPGITFKDNMGCLEINAPFISKTPIQTNDKVQLISNTKFKWIGRSSLTINSGGIKFNPENIEKTLSNYYTQPFIISSFPDSVLGEKIVIVFEKKIPAEPKKFFNQLNKHQRPKEVFFLTKFERTNGKINRQNIKSNILNKYAIGK
tara:strand:+ start:983 stop:2038 length:1056 start_codon:yes stop_codon:yes gene_type:complete